MASFWDRVRYHTRSFFTNWATYDAPFARKVGLTFRNRVRGVTSMSGCCGNHGQPGC